MLKCLFLNNGNLSNESQSGAIVLSKTFFECLQKIYGRGNVEYINISLSSFSRWKWFKGIMNVNILSVDKRYEKELLQKIKRGKYDVVVLGTSNMGFLSKKIKKQCPNCKIGVLFHNVEYQYFQEFARIEGKHKLPLAFLAKYNEKIALHYGDVHFVLNSRDEALLREIYGFEEVVTKLPICLKDKFVEDKIVHDDHGSVEALFVGSDFFPNREGMDWFVDNVMPYVDIKLNIVGKGMEKYRKRWERDNVEVLGTVDDLSQYYYNADLVVEPIFSGGGMKTKTAEALMYGKIIFGTQEAFQGYEIKYGKNAELCMTAQEFICAINRWSSEKKFRKVNEISRLIFENNYSIKQMACRISDALR